MLDDLEVTITRTDSMRPQSLGSSGHKERVVPFNQKASNARVALEKALRQYALRVAIATRVPAPHGPKAHAAYLVERLPGIPDNAPSIEGIFRAVVGASDAARRTIDRPIERAYTGTCECGARLYSPQHAEVVQCYECGLRWDVQERRDWLLEQARDTYGTVAELARLLPWFDGRPILSSSIERWVKCGRLRSRVIDGRTVFRIGDVVALHRLEHPPVDADPFAA